MDEKTFNQLYFYFPCQTAQNSRSPRNSIMIQHAIQPSSYTAKPPQCSKQPAINSNFVVYPLPYSYACQRVQGHIEASHTISSHLDRWYLLPNLYSLRFLIGNTHMRRGKKQTKGQPANVGLTCQHCQATHWHSGNGTAVQCTLLSDGHGILEVMRSTFVVSN